MRLPVRAILAATALISVTAWQGVWASPEPPAADRCAQEEPLDTPIPASPQGVLSAAHDDEAQLLEQRLGTTNLYYCQALTAVFTDPSRTTLAGYDDWGDSSLYTADVLAAESFRFRVMEQQARDPASPPRMRHQAARHRDEALSRITGLIDRLDFDIHISKNWHGDGQPGLNPAPPQADGDYWIATTGGLPAWEAGYPMRLCLPADASLGPPRSTRRFLIDDDQGRSWLCEAGTSRDTYTGYFFGLMTAFNLVGPEQPRLQRTIGDDVLLMYDFLVKYAFTTPRPTGRVTVSPDSFDGSTSVLFTDEPFSRVWLAAAARHVASIAGTPAQAAYYEALWQSEWANQSPSIQQAWAIDSSTPNGDAIAWNLTNLSLYATLANLTDPRSATAEDLARAQQLVDWYDEVDRWTKNDDNAWFDAVASSTWTDTARQQRSARLLLDWIDYRHNFESGTTFSLDPTRCDLPTSNPQHLDCVHEDRVVKWVPHRGEVTVYEGTGSYVTSLPRPIAQRRPEEFLWQRWGGIMQSRSYAARQPTGVDFLLPYWMIRYYTEVRHNLGLQAPTPLLGQ